mgnify:CR=1 FL=1
MVRVADRRLDELPKSERPRCGPLAVLRWHPASRKWVRRLTAKGQRMADDYIRNYPNTGAVLWRTYPSLARVAFERFPNEEVHQAARIGVAKGFTLFDPARGVAAPTFIVPHIRVAVQALVRRRVAPPSVQLPADLIAQEPDALRWTGDDWQNLLKSLPNREREIVWLRFVANQTLGEIGERVGLSKERVRQIQAIALERLRNTRPDLLASWSIGSCGKAPARS